MPVQALILPDRRRAEGRGRAAQVVVRGRGVYTLGSIEGVHMRRRTSEWRGINKYQRQTLARLADHPLTHSCEMMGSDPACPEGDE